jgi:hypothetical protein
MPWIRIVLGAGLALMLTRIAAKNSARQPASSSQSPGERAPVAAETSPRFASFIHRHALAEIATLFGIPLAVIGLLFTTLATRDAAREQQVANEQLAASIDQVRVAEQAAQPELFLQGRLVPGASANSPDRFNRLSLEVRGVARQVRTEIDTAIVVTDRADQRITYIDWWTWAGARTGEAASWTSSPRLLRGLDRRQQKKAMWVDSIVSVSYADVFGKFHTKYFRVTERLGARSPYATGPASVIGEARDPSRTVRCLQAASLQRDQELGRSGVDGVVRTPTKVYARLAQGNPITLSDLEASMTLTTPEECLGV